LEQDIAEESVKKECRGELEDDLQDDAYNGGAWGCISIIQLCQTSRANDV
jgi:hypothetical protein